MRRNPMVRVSSSYFPHFRSKVVAPVKMLMIESCELSPLNALAKPMGTLFMQGQESMYGQNP